MFDFFNDMVEGVIWRKNRDYRTVREIGLKKLSGFLEKGRRVIVKPKRALGYSFDRDFGSVGRGGTTVLPNQYGAIVDIETEGMLGRKFSGDEMHITELWWLNKGFDEKHVRMQVVEEERLDDLLVVGLVRGT
jgi:hypothetical protein